MHWIFENGKMDLVILLFVLKRRGPVNSCLTGFRPPNATLLWKQMRQPFQAEEKHQDSGDL